VNIHPLCVLAVLVAGCASLPARDGAVETRLAEALERRGLGADALSVIGNLLAHGSPPPPMAPAAVLEALARPLAALDVAGQFERAVPASLRALERLPAPGSFEAALRTYIRELAQAHPWLPVAVLKAFTNPGWSGVQNQRAYLYRAVLNEAIRAGGTTLRDYRTVTGESGRNQEQLACYGRYGEPCLRCATILRRTVLDGRTTTWCPTCQKR